MTNHDQPQDTPLPPPSAKDLIRAGALADEAIYARGPTGIATQWNLWVLHGELVQSAKLFRSPGLQDKRDAIAASLIAVRTFLESQGFNVATVEPILHPVFALIEREQNRLDPIFCARKRDGAPRRSMDEYSKIGAIAALAEAWLTLHKDSGGKVNDKLQRFIRHIDGSFFKGLNLSRVKAARAMVSQEASDHSAVSWFNLYSEHIAIAADVWGPAAAITVVANSLNRHDRTAEPTE